MAENNESNPPEATLPSMSPADTGQHELEAEIFMTAGPRKENLEEGSDSELGEDAGGILMRQNACYFWVADGTSESGSGGYTSRVLAQDLGDQFIKFVKQNNPARNTDDISKVLLTVLDEVKDKWNQWQKTPSANTNQTIEASAVFICGWLTSSRSLRSISYGDAWLLYEKDGRLIQAAKNEHRFFLRGQFDQTKSEWAWETSKRHQVGEPCVVENVSLIIAGSDGAKVLQTFLQLPVRDNGQGVIQSLHDQMRTANQKPSTWDDKTLCTVQVI